MHILLFVGIPVVLALGTNFSTPSPTLEAVNSAQRTAVSVLLVCLLPLGIMECVMRVWTSVMLGLFGCRAALAMKNTGWNYFRVAHVFLLVGGIALIWAIDAFRDASKKRSHGDTRHLFILGFSMLVIATVANICYRVCLQTRSKYKSAGLHWMLVIENWFNITWQAAVCIAFCVVLHAHGPEEVRFPQCNPECHMNAMRWFTGNSSTYTGPITQASTQSYNVTMEICQEEGNYAPSLGEDCKFSAHCINIFLSILALYSLPVFMFDVALNVGSWRWSMKLNLQSDNSPTDSINSTNGEAAMDENKALNATPPNDASFNNTEEESEPQPEEADKSDEPEKVQEGTKETTDKELTSE